MSKFCGGCGNQVPDGLNFCTNCGRPRAGAGGTGGQEQQAQASQVGPGGATSGRPAPAQPHRAADDPYLRKRGSKRPLVIIGGIAAVLILFAVTVTVLQSTVFGPKAAVNAYFGALEDRDAEKALARISSGSSSGEGSTGSGSASEELLTDKVLGAKQYQPPTDVEITSTKASSDSGDDDSDSQEANVSYQVAGERQTATMRVWKSDDKRFGLFDKWIIEGGRSSLSLATGPPYTVNGQELKAPDEQGGGEDGGDGDDGDGGYGEGESAAPTSYAAFPGGYEVAVPGNPLFSSATKKVTVTLKGEPAQVNLDPDIKPAAITEVRKQVTAYIDLCAGETTLQPDGCPLGVYGGSDPRNVKWTVTKYPTIRLAQENGSRVSVVTDDGSEGSATVTYEAKGYFGDEYESQTGTSSITVAGVVVVKGGKLDWLSPRDVEEKP
ncbi:MAG: hypothetical protein GEV10_08450 [Streptosporangiales bacterium]|nr:hypothetical protein [Streptosporangiales bacterium]